MTYEEFGMVEGLIDIVLDQGVHQVFIIDAVSLLRIRCYFAKGMLPVFVAAAGKRVKVVGDIEYRLGKPVWVYVDDPGAVYEVPDSNGLPPPQEELRGSAGCQQ